MTPEEYVRNMQARDNDEKAREHALADVFKVAAVVSALAQDEKAEAIAMDEAERDPSWGTCKHCGCDTDGGRPVCSDCYNRKADDDR